MRNSYFVLRHGESTANLAGIVLSRQEDGEKIDYTLTPEGEEQVRRSVTKSKESGELDANTIIITSPFSRTRRTAEIAKEVLGAERDIVVEERLRERWFGDWERSSNDAYEKVWAADKENPDHTIAHVESARDVQMRTMALIHDLENQYDGKTILLVSHGDALQLLLTGIEKQSPALHRNTPHLETAEIRKVVET
ncbi:MAG: histidine phosphatase family protein [Minisyncoccota bacterium]